MQEEDKQMVKHGNVVVGDTPSEVSGEKSETIKKGHAVTNTEDAPQDERSLDIPLD